MCDAQVFFLLGYVMQSTNPSCEAKESFLYLVLPIFLSISDYYGKPLPSMLFCIMIAQHTSKWRNQNANQALIFLLSPIQGTLPE